MERDSRRAHVQRILHREQMSGYLRPYVACTDCLPIGNAFADHGSHTTLTFSILPSMHPPIMTLDVHDPVKREAFSFNCKSHLLVELQNRSCVEYFERWISDLPTILLDRIQAMHIVLDATNGTCPTVVGPGGERLLSIGALPNPIEFGRSQEDLLPTIRLDIGSSGKEILIKGHCKLIAPYADVLHGSLENWKSQRKSRADFNGTDLVDLVAHLRLLARGRTWVWRDCYRTKSSSFPIIPGFKQERSFDWAFDVGKDLIESIERAQESPPGPLWPIDPQYACGDARPHGWRRQGVILVVPKKVFGTVLGRVTVA